MTSLLCAPQPNLDVHRRRDLLALGMTTRKLESLVARGRLTPLPGGWFATADTPEDVVIALRSRTRLTCVSALRLQGFWDVSAPGLHVAARRSGDRSSRSRVETGLVFHSPPPTAWPGASAIMPPDIALEHAVRCLGAEDGAILLESGLRCGLIDDDDVDAVLSRLPLRTRSAVGSVRSDADSGTETKVRRFFEKLRVPVRAQVSFLDGRWRVDLLVGERLVIECDSIAHHTGVDGHARTYRKRLELQQLGLHVVNLSYAQVMFEWEATKEILLDLVRRGAHRGPRR